MILFQTLFIQALKRLFTNLSFSELLKHADAKPARKSLDQLTQITDLPVYMKGVITIKIILTQYY